MDLITSDLKSTTKGYWWLGRKLRVRLHLAVYILQLLYKKTDRAMEENLKYNAVYQLFTGVSFLPGWRAPDHTKIETFRNRLTPETQRAIANSMAVQAVELGFADPTQVDLDSTVQEANASYPSDARLMQNLAEKCKKIIESLKEDKLIPGELDIDIKAIKSAAKGYFFLAKNTAKDIKRNAFAALHKLVKTQTYPIINWLEKNAEKTMNKNKWNISNAIEQVLEHGRRYLLDVAHFVRTNSMKAEKRLSFHLDDIQCIVKNKIGKKYEFGRVFQLARIGGNFSFVGKCTDLYMSDKEAIAPIIEEHSHLFGERKISSFTGDKGYYSKKNMDALQKAEICDFHLGYQYTDQSDEDYHRLYNRRAGVEPIIGHIKTGGQLGKSKMKSDNATLAAGYASVCSFNLRQLMRKIA